MEKNEFVKSLRNFGKETKFGKNIIRPIVTAGLTGVLTFGGTTGCAQREQPAIEQLVRNEDDLAELGLSSETYKEYLRVKGIVNNPYGENGQEEDLNKVRGDLISIMLLIAKEKVSDFDYRRCQEEVDKAFNNGRTVVTRIDPSNMDINSTYNHNVGETVVTLKNPNGTNERLVVDEHSTLGKTIFAIVGLEGDEKVNKVPTLEELQKACETTDELIGDNVRGGFFGELGTDDNLTYEKRVKEYREGRDVNER